MNLLPLTQKELQGYLRDAVIGNHVEIVLELLYFGADPNLGELIKEDHLRTAIAKGHEKIAMVLLQNNTNPLTQNNTFNLTNFTNLSPLLASKSNLPLHLAAAAGSVSTLAALLTSILRLKNSDGYSVVDLLPDKISREKVENIILLPLERGISILRSQQSKCALFDARFFFTDEIAKKITVYLDFVSMHALSCVNHRWRAVIHEFSNEIIEKESREKKKKEKKGSK